jgi:phage shock protein PspC (stress-responsive transcriptional regulator)
MNKVVTIHLRGTALQLEEAGYEALRAYLDGAASNLEGNPDKDEILADIEQAIADKCRAMLGAFKNVVVTHEIQQIIEEMGPVQDAAAEGEERPSGVGGAAAAGASSGAAGPGAATAESGAPPRVRRLYKIHDGAMFAGVCNGLAVFFGIDPTLVRLLFVLLTFFWGFAIVVYLILMFILPSPETAAEKAAAYGVAATAQEFIRRAREGYYEGMRTFGDRHAHREWRRRFKREMRGWGRRLEQEMRESACRWQQHWQPPNWTPAPAPSFALLVTLPFLALLRGVLAVIGLLALISLLVTHTVFGLAPPANMPLWVAVILLIVIYCIVVWPLKALRRAWYWHAARGPVFVPPLFWLVDTVVGLGCVVLLFWFIDRHVPQAHEAFMGLPAALHHGVDIVKHWWSSR